jgi:hypothetical protein
MSLEEVEREYQKVKSRLQTLEYGNYSFATLEEYKAHENLIDQMRDRAIELLIRESDILRYREINQELNNHEDETE